MTNICINLILFNEKQLGRKIDLVDTAMQSVAWTGINDIITVLKKIIYFIFY